MQVILKEDVHNLGKAGELVKVKPGFGRNFLIPQGKAVVATAGNVKQIEHEKKVIAAKQAKLAKDAQAMGDRLASVEVQIERAGRRRGQALRLGHVARHRGGAARTRASCRSQEGAHARADQDDRSHVEIRRSAPA